MTKKSNKSSKKKNVLKSIILGVIIGAIGSPLVNIGLILFSLGKLKII